MKWRKIGCRWGRGGAILELEMTSNCWAAQPNRTKCVMSQTIVGYLEVRLVDGWELAHPFERFDGLDSPMIPVDCFELVYNNASSPFLFSALAGWTLWDEELPSYGGPVAPARGLPSDISERLQHHISDWEMGPGSDDDFMHSWLTLRELSNFDWSKYHKDWGPEESYLIREMQKFGDGDPDAVRVLFWWS